MMPDEPPVHCCGQLGLVHVLSVQAPRYMTPFHVQRLLDWQYETARSWQHELASVGVLDALELQGVCEVASLPSGQ